VKFPNRLQTGWTQSIFVVAPLEAAGLIASQRCEAYVYAIGYIETET
jgi:hypothetical protein